ncbi:MAG: recombinase family protein [Acidobacteria bacterium]|nr:recombinase family protein [Acidobacteriota bacterium]
MARVRRALRAVANTATAPAVTRAAIYTRKSTTAGLDSNFTSLQNQRERGENYIASQGWTLETAPYDDGGFSGGNTDRPALQQLMQRVEAREFDVIVVYRLDRISRSLVDFVKIHDFLDRHDVALVSVTESINTTTPHGRMMVNVLLSFAQYERELAAERTRHKIEAARRRGKWTGGRPVLGYDVVDGCLAVNKDEATQVKAIFELYVETPSLITVVQELNRRGWTQKRWTTKTGNECGGSQWNKSSLRTLLTNPLYVGKQKLGDETFKGEHKGVVVKKLFDRVQGLMTGNRDCSSATRNGAGFLLRGLLRCSACDAAMVPSSTRRGARRYRYYLCSKRQKRGRDSCPTKPISADKVEAFIVDQIRRIGADPKLQDQTFRQAVGQVKAQRRGLRRERKMLERDLTTSRADVERLVGAVSRTAGPAADAIATELEKAQSHVQIVDARIHEIDDELDALKAQDVDRDDLARALEEFDPIWDALLIPERERVMRLLVEKIDYDGGAGTMTIQWRLSGFGELAAEVAP